MNVADKPRFYAEAFRVLRPGGVFAFSHYGAGPRGEPYYPSLGGGPGDELPRGARGDAGARSSPPASSSSVFRDRTEEVMPDLRENRRRLEEHGLPALGLQTLMGERSGSSRSTSPGARRRAGSPSLEALARKPA